MNLDKENLYPPALKEGDTIAIVSPAGKIAPCKVERATEVLENAGWNVEKGEFVLGEYENYSGTPQQRLSDIVKVLTNPEVKAVICSRGGYGAVHLLEELDKLPINENPKWLVGFSDISALHALFNGKGIATVHGPMTKDISNDIADPSVASLFKILRGEKEEFTFSSSPFDRPGLATGTLVGGNLSVIAELLSTPYNVIEPGVILFIEDLAEPLYKIERIFYQLRLNGVLERLGGLVVGQFTDYKPDIGYEVMEEMIHKMVEPYTYPVAMNVPSGHIDRNMPLILGAKVTLRVTLGETNSIVYW